MRSTPFRSHLIHVQTWAARLQERACATGWDCKKRSTMDPRGTIVPWCTRLWKDPDFQPNKEGDTQLWTSTRAGNINSTAGHDLLDAQAVKQTAPMLGSTAAYSHYYCSIAFAAVFQSLSTIDCMHEASICLSSGCRYKYPSSAHGKHNRHGLSKHNVYKRDSTPRTFNKSLKRRGSNVVRGKQPHPKTCSLLRLLRTQHVGTCVQVQAQPRGAVLLPWSRTLKQHQRIELDRFSCKTSESWRCDLSDS